MEQAHPLNLPVVELTWSEFDCSMEALSRSVLRDGRPDLIVAIQRGGLVPAVFLSHQLSVRTVIPIACSRTANDDIYSSKNPAVLGETHTLTATFQKDVLIVDDIAGTGATLEAVQAAITCHLPLRIRSLVCLVNSGNWNSSRSVPEQVITYIGEKIYGWAVFPWEQRARGSSQQREKSR